jgi:predicted DNA-binding transcriptional regulator AlpA
MEPQRFLTERRVTELTTLHRTQIARMVKAGAFPTPIYVSERRKVFSEAEISAWMEAATANRREHPRGMIQRVSVEGSLAQPVEAGK